jgi:hypothetical protein
MNSCAVIPCIGKSGYSFQPRMGTTASPPAFSSLFTSPLHLSPVMCAGPRACRRLLVRADRRQLQDYVLVRRTSRFSGETFIQFPKPSGLIGPLDFASGLRGRKRKRRGGSRLSTFPTRTVRAPEMRVLKRCFHALAISLTLCAWSGHQ